MVKKAEKEEMKPYNGTYIVGAGIAHLVGKLVKESCFVEHLFKFFLSVRIFGKLPCILNPIRLAAVFFEACRINLEHE